MKTKTTIAGLSIELQFCKKITEQPITSEYISKEPLVNIYASGKQEEYTVNILSQIPQKLNEINEENAKSGLFLNDTNTLLLNYSGVNTIGTSVSKENGMLLCRDFNIDYNCPEKKYSAYDLYHIQFNYSLQPKYAQSVEAIIVHDKNLDPETDRGTVTTVRKDDR